MTARILDGKEVARQIRDEVAAGVARLRADGHPVPGLAVILVGSDPASTFYVKSKTKACLEAGFHSVQINLPESVSERELLDKLLELCDDTSIHGILVQMPLPRHIDEQRIIEAVTPVKDVDGFHPLNVGRLAIGLKGFVPCTPLGVRELLIRSGIETAGRRAVVIGRSNIVGKPMAALLMAKGKGGEATVTVCHSRTRDLAGVCREADIVIAAMGKAHFVTADMIKPGATVIDVGINRIDDASDKRGYRLVGDVDYSAVAQVAGAITPVPGGVGPLTIAMLLSNTYNSARLHAGLGAEW